MAGAEAGEHAPQQELAAGNLAPVLDAAIGHDEDVPEALLAKIFKEYEVLLEQVSGAIDAGDVVGLRKTLHEAELWAARTGENWKLGLRASSTYELARAVLKATLARPRAEEEEVPGPPARTASSSSSAAAAEGWTKGATEQIKEVVTQFRLVKEPHGAVAKFSAQHGTDSYTVQQLFGTLGRMVGLELFANLEEVTVDTVTEALAHLGHQKKALATALIARCTAFTTYKVGAWGV
jgi:hypothetical protein